MWKEKAQMHSTNKEKALYIRTYDVANLPQASTNFYFLLFSFSSFGLEGVSSLKEILTKQTNSSKVFEKKLAKFFQRFLCD